MAVVKLDVIAESKKAISGINKFVKSLDKIKKSSETITKSLQRQNAALNKLTKRINSTGRSTQAFSHRSKTATKTITAQTVQTASLGKVTHGLRSALEALGATLAVMTTRFGLLATSTKGWAIILSAIASATIIGSVVKGAVNLEDQMLAVRKTTGLVSIEMKKLTKNFIDMSKEIPLSTEELAQIGAVAGQIGIRGTKNISEFTRVISMMATVTDLAAEEAAIAISQLSNVFRIPIPDVERLGSVINELSNTTAATARDLAIIAKQAGSAATVFGLTASQTLAFAAVLRDIGVTSEVAGTALSQLFTKLVTNTKRIARSAEIDFTTLSNAVKNEPVKAVQMLFDKLSKLSKTEAASALKKMGFEGKRATSVMFGLMNNTSLLNKTLKTAEGEWETNTSLMKEFSIFTSGVKRQFILFKNEISAVAITLGTNFLPIFQKVITEIKGSLVPALGSAAKVVKENQKSISDFLVNTLITIKTVFKTLYIALTGANSAAIVLGKTLLTLWVLGRIKMYAAILTTMTTSMNLIASSPILGFFSKLNLMYTTTTKRANQLNLALTKTSKNARTAFIGFMSLANALNLLFAGFVGFQIGTWIEKWDKVKLVALATIGALGKGFYSLKDIWAQVTGTMQIIWYKMLGSISEKLEDSFIKKFIDKFKSIPQFVLRNLSPALADLVLAFGGTENATNNYNDAIAELEKKMSSSTEELKKNKKIVDETIVSLFNDIQVTRKLGEETVTLAKLKTKLAGMTVKTVQELTDTWERYRKDYKGNVEAIALIDKTFSELKIKLTRKEMEEKLKADEERLTKTLSNNNVELSNFKETIEVMSKFNENYYKKRLIGNIDTLESLVFSENEFKKLIKDNADYKVIVEDFYYAKRIELAKKSLEAISSLADKSTKITVHGLKLQLESVKGNAAERERVGRQLVAAVEKNSNSELINITKHYKNVIGVHGMYSTETIEATQNMIMIINALNEKAAADKAAIIRFIANFEIKQQKKILKEIFKGNEAKLKSEQDYLKNIIKDNSENLSKRLTANKKFISNIKKLADLREKYEKDIIEVIKGHWKGSQEDLIKLVNAFQEKIKAIRQEEVKDVEEAENQKLKLTQEFVSNIGKLFGSVGGKWAGVVNAMLVAFQEFTRSSAKAGSTMAGSLGNAFGALGVALSGITGSTGAFGSAIGAVSKVAGAYTTVQTGMTNAIAAANKAALAGSTTAASLASGLTSISTVAPYAAAAIAAGTIAYKAFSKANRSAAEKLGITKKGIEGVSQAIGVSITELGKWRMGILDTTMNIGVALKAIGELANETVNLTKILGGSSGATNAVISLSDAAYGLGLAYQNLALSQLQVEITSGTLKEETINLENATNILTQESLNYEEALQNLARQQVITNEAMAAHEAALNSVTIANQAVTQESIHFGNALRTLSAEAAINGGQTAKLYKEFTALRDHLIASTISSEAFQKATKDLTLAQKIQAEASVKQRLGLDNLSIATGEYEKTLMTLIATTGLSAEEQGELIQQLIRSKGNVEVLSSKTARYNEVLKQMGIEAAKGNAPALAKLANEARALRTELGLGTTTYEKNTKSINNNTNSLANNSSQALIINESMTTLNTSIGELTEALLAINEIKLNNKTFSVTQINKTASPTASSSPAAKSSQSAMSMSSSLIGGLQQLNAYQIQDKTYTVTQVNKTVATSGFPSSGVATGSGSPALTSAKTKLSSQLIGILSGRGYAGNQLNMFMNQIRRVSALGNQTKSYYELLEKLTSDPTLSIEETGSLITQLRGLFRNLGLGTKSVAHSSMSSYDGGTSFVPKNTIASIHRGERVVPASENKVLTEFLNQIKPFLSKKGTTGTGGGNVTVKVENLFAKDLNSLIDEINEDNRRRDVGEFNVFVEKQNKSNLNLMDA